MWKLQSKFSTLALGNVWTICKHRWSECSYVENSASFLKCSQMSGLVFLRPPSSHIEQSYAGRVWIKYPSSYLPHQKFSQVIVRRWGKRTKARRAWETPPWLWPERYLANTSACGAASSSCGTTWWTWRGPWGCSPRLWWRRTAASLCRFGV